MGIYIGIDGMKVGGEREREVQTGLRLNPYINMYNALANY